MYYEEAAAKFAAKREALNLKNMEKYKAEVAAYADDPMRKEPPKRAPRKIPDEFKFRHCWEVLRESIAFNRTIPKPRKRRRIPTSNPVNFELPKNGSETMDHAALDDQEFNQGIQLLKKCVCVCVDSRMHNMQTMNLL